MSITNVNEGASLTGATNRERQNRPARERFAKLQVGQTLDLKVMARLDDKRVVAQFDGANHLVETAMALTAGATLRVTVTGIGDKLELKQVGSSPAAVRATPTAHGDSAQGATSELLSQMQDEYAVQLSGNELQLLNAQMQAVTDPDRMATSGLFLQKLQGQLDASELQAVYAALSWAAPLNQLHRRALDVTAAPDILTGPDSNGAKVLSEAIAERLQTGPSSGQSPMIEVASRQGTPESSMSDDEQSASRDLADRLLNVQDDGSVAYSFGRVPLLIANQLVELDVVLFRDRQGSGSQREMRRLVMSLQTEALGRVEVMAQAVGERLTIALTSQTSAASETLSKYADEIQSLVTSLGWNVDSIRYDVDPNNLRAANHVATHVLSAGSVDRLF